MFILSALLVLIWSTGFIVGKLIVGYIDPNIYLAIRFFFAALMFTGIALFFRRPWPSKNELPKHLVAGILMNSLYLGLSYLAVSKGLPAGLMALLGALQPVLVTILAFLIVKERPSRLGLLGMLIGILGLALVVSPALQFDMGGSVVTSVTLLLGGLAVLALSFGVTFQKLSISVSDIITSMAVQNGAALIVALVFIYCLGEQTLVLNTTSTLSLVWGVIVLSGGGLFLMVWLVRKVAAAKVSILLLLAPPLAAVESYFIFDETMTSLQILGFAITIMGVYLSRVRG